MDKYKIEDLPLEYKGKDDKVIFERGLSLYSKGQYREALLFFHHITSPNFEVLKFYHLGLTYVQLGELNKGLSYYRKIREIPSDVQGIEYDRIMYGLYLNMGSTMQVLAKKKGKSLYREAIECYKLALQINKTDSRVWNNLGNAYIEIDSNSEAIKSFEEALKLDPEYSEAHYSISLAYEFSAQYRKALYHLRQALKEKPNNKLILNRIAALEFGTGNFEEAKQFAERVLVLDEKNITALKNIILILYNMGRYSTAYEYYLKFKRLAPNFSDKEVIGIFRDLEKRIQFSNK
ncbi:tetratricopeptide repeat protein [Candidatus Harpocratesius sp.]